MRQSVEYMYMDLQHDLYFHVDFIASDENSAALKRFPHCLEIVSLRYIIATHSLEIFITETSSSASLYKFDINARKNL